MTGASRMMPPIGDSDNGRHEVLGLEFWILSVCNPQFAIRDPQ
jgi:hypothetical protein